MKKILIVDDEKDMTWSLSRGLSKKFPDCQIFAANSFQEAQDFFDKNKVDLLITDFRMPDGDGIALIGIAKRKNTGIFSVLMTAYGSADLVQSLTQHPDIVYIEKPFEIEKLREIITQWIAYPSASKNTQQRNQVGQKRTKVVSQVVFS